MKVVLLVFLLSVLVNAQEHLIGDVSTSIKKGNLIAVIPELNKEYLVSFQVKPTLFLPGFHSVVHLTIGENDNNYGDRVPGVWFHEDGKGGLYISGPINGDLNRYFITNPVALNQWTQVEIAQSIKQDTYGVIDYIYTIKINGKVVFTEINQRPQVFKNVKVYMSDPWHEAQNGQIKNMYILNKLSNTVSTTLPPVVIVPKEHLIGDVSTSIKKGNLIAVIPELNKEYLVSFQVKPTLFLPGFHSVVHLTIGENDNNYGDRVPGVWFHEDGKGGLYISGPINGDLNRYFITNPVALNQWTHVEIAQSIQQDTYGVIEYIYTIKINGKVVFTEINQKPQVFKNVKVYMSDPWHEAQNGQIKNLYILNKISNTVSTTLPPVVIVPKELINQRKEFNLTASSLIGVLNVLRKEYTVSFSIKPKSYSKGWMSVLHLTLGKDSGTYGDRNPGVWLHEDGSGKLAIFAAISGNNNYYVETAPLPLDQWSHIKICQGMLDGKYWFSVELNGLKIHRVENSDSREFQNMNVYASDPWYAAQEGSISNLLIINGNAESILGNSNIPLVKGKIVAEIPKLDKEYLVSFDVYPNKFVAGWHSVIHFTICSDVSKYGDRVPGVWFFSDGLGGLHISAPINGNVDRVFTTKPVELKQWSNVEISQILRNSVYIYTIRLNGEIVFSEINTLAQSFDNVKVYTSDPWYDVQDGSIRNLFIVNGPSSNDPLLNAIILPSGLR